MSVLEPKTCPSADVLAGFRRGRLGDADLELVAEHLSTCAECAAVLTTSAEADSELARLKRSLKQPPLPEEEACAKLAARAKALWSESFELNLDVPAEPPIEFPVPRVLGPYELLEALDSGGMGDIYKARHQRLKKLVALKTLTRNRAADPTALARFDREMEASGALPDHPNVVRATDADQDHGVHYLVMEYLAGVDLARLVARRGPLPVADACEIVRQAVLGLAHLHAHGLVHRDFKPSNLLLSTSGTVKILDLGLALMPPAADKADTLTGHWTLMGTADYIAPDQIFDAHHVTTAADLYSVGCTLFKLLTGRAPFEDEEHSQRSKKLRAHSMEPPPRLRDFRADVPAELDELVNQLLAKAPEERTITAEAVADQLTEFAAGNSLARLAEEYAGESGPRVGPDTPSVRRGPTERLTRPQPPGSRRRWRLIIAAAALAMVAAILGFGSQLGGRQDKREENEVVMDQWVHPFREKKPSKLVFSNIFDGSHFAPDPAHDMMSVNYYGAVALIRCGEAPPGSIVTLEMGIKQERNWATSAGFFFGYTEVQGPSGRESLRFQKVVINAKRSPGATKPYEFELERAVVTQNGATGANSPLAATRIVPPNLEGINTLSIKFSAKHGLVEVLWNQNPIPELTGAQVNHGMMPADYAGLFGVYQLYGNATYHSFRYFIENERD